MQPKDFSQNAPGELLPLDGGALAFKPAKLPLSRPLDASRLLLPLASATTALGRLDGIARQIENPEYLFQNHLRREAMLSSAIEGTHTTIAGLVLYEASKQGDHDAKEVSNYVEALNLGLGAVKHREINKQLLHEMHQKLMEGSDPLKTSPGAFRNCLVQLGEGSLAEARFVPPPEIFVEELMDDMIAYISIEDGTPALVRLAIAHYQFETIHPYRDGNGRIGRLLFMLYLAKRAILSTPLLYLSSYLERHRQRYYDHLLAVSQHDQWEEWIIFFLDGIAQQADDSVERTLRIVELRETYRKLVMGPKKATNLLRLIDDLFNIPATSVGTAMKATGVTYPAARKYIDILIDLGILSPSPVPIGGTQYWVAGGIVRLTE